MPPEESTADDLLTFRLGRRVLRRDVARVAGLADGLLAGTAHLDPRRLPVFTVVVERLCDEILGEQAFEETLLWPELARHAPDALPYDALAGQRTALRGSVDDARRASRTVVRNLTARPAALATAGDHRDVGALAAAWRALDAGLGVFFDATDEEVATAVVAHVPRASWLDLLEKVQRGLPDRRAAGARVVEVATAGELTALTQRLGARPIAGWRGHGRRRRAEDALLFGPGPSA